MEKGYHTKDVKTPITGMAVITNSYWLCKDSDPTQAIFFNGTAQCNRHKEIPERMLEYTKNKTGWDIGIVFLDLAYRPTLSWDNK